MLLNKYKDYGLERNPFPAQVYGESSIYDDDVVSTELTEFREKLVLGALSEKRPMSFLWSLGDYGSDTGFGKTALLRRIERRNKCRLGQDHANKSRRGRIGRSRSSDLCGVWLLQSPRGNQLLRGIVFCRFRLSGR